MKKVQDIMTKDVVYIDGSATVADAILEMIERNLRSLIVKPRSDDDAFGMVTEVDICYKVVACGKDPKKVLVHEIMTKPCVVLNPELGVKYAARLFENVKVHRAPVIKERVLGIVSIADIIRHLD